MKFEVEEIRKLFPWFTHHPDVVYFDNAATTLKPESVINAYTEYYAHFGTNPHNVSCEFTYQLKQRINQSRIKLATFFNCQADNIIFTSGATESLNLFAFGLREIIQPNDNIVLTEYEHSSNILPWYELAHLTNATVRVVKPAKMNVDLGSLLNNIDQNTKVVTFSNCSNLLGYKCDAITLAQQIKKRFPNIIVCVDATQYVQHNRLDLNEANGIDFCAFSFHKIYGPNGVGVAYISKKWLDVLKPWKLGGGCYDSYTTDPNKMYKLLDGYPRFEAGTPNVSGIFAVDKTIDFLNNIDWDKMADHEMKLAKKMFRDLKRIDNVEIVNSKFDVPVIAFSYKGINPQDIANYLGKNNIIVRAGHACSPLACRLLDNTDGFVRVSIGCYNTPEEVDFFIEKMRSFSKGDIIF